MSRTRISAGLLMYRHRDQKLQLLLVHPSVPHFPSIVPKTQAFGPFRREKERSGNRY